MPLGLTVHVSGVPILQCSETRVVKKANSADSAAGLLILGRKCMYVLDGLVRLDTGEVVGSEEAPRDMFSIPSGKIAEVQSNEMETSRW